MRKMYFIIAAVALALCSCGGNGNGRVQEQGVDSLSVSVMADMLAPDINEDVAEEVFKMLFPEVKNSGENGMLSYSGDYEEDCEGCYSGASVYCYPMADGRYLVISKEYSAGPGCSASYYFGTRVYKNGTLDTIVGVLPMPQLDQLLNPSKTREYQGQIAEFRKMYDEAPLYYLSYRFMLPDVLKVVLYPYDCEDVYYEMDQCMLSEFNNDKLLEYAWDGKCFTCTSTALFKPTGEDVFPKDCDTVCFVQGDLNKDDIQDLVLVATPRDPENMMVRDDGYEYNFNKPVLAVYFGKADGTYSLFNEYPYTIPGAEDEFTFVTVESEITAKGVLKLFVEYFNSAGSSENDNNTYLFRFQDGDFYLIGSDSEASSRYSGEAVKVSRNYLTKRQSTTTYNMFDDKVKPTETWTDLPDEPLEKLGERMLN